MAKASKKTELEDAFYLHWQMMFGGLPLPIRQHPILNPKTGRNWKIDFCWVEERICVEIQGGSWVRGGHNTAQGQHSDYERHNHLTRNGFRCFYFNTIAMKNTADVVEFVAETLCNAS